MWRCSKKKIAIIGSGGSGKSTLARQLGELLQLPVYHLDSLHWKPGWVPTPDKEWDQLMDELVLREEWIIDGNYGRTMEARLQAADTIIFLDFPTYKCLYGILKRRYQYRGRTRPDMGKGCEEKIDFEFFNWILTFRRNKRPGILKQLDEVKDRKNILIFHNRRHVKNFLESMQ